MKCHPHLAGGIFVAKVIDWISDFRACGIGE